MDQIVSMRIISQIAARGSISAAARSVGLSPTMVTRHLDAVEERLGIRLFQRSTRRMVRTEEGQTYLDFAQHILAEIKTGEDALMRRRVEAEGLLRLSAPLSFGVRYIAPLMADFAALHPKVRVELGLNDRVVDLAEEGWDVGVRIGRLSDSALITRKLAAFHMMLCASPTYIAAHGLPSIPADLSAHQCLGYTLASDVGMSKWTFGANRDIRIPITGGFHANNGDALVAAAIAGLGIIYQPTFIAAEAVRRGDLIAFGQNWGLLDPGAVYVLYPRLRSMPSKVRAMVDFLVTAFADPPIWASPRNDGSMGMAS